MFTRLLTASVLTIGAIGCTATSTERMNEAQQEGVNLAILLEGRWKIEVNSEVYIDIDGILDAQGRSGCNVHYYGRDHFGTVTMLDEQHIELTYVSKDVQPNGPYYMKGSPGVALPPGSDCECSEIYELDNGRLYWRSRKISAINADGSRYVLGKIPTLAVRGEPWRRLYDPNRD